jgi:carbamoyl-phosphate synthase small subunit
MARLALEDGAVFAGSAFGACDRPLSATGEVVFNTAQCGYQEALTDPSYAGQILTMTAPMIGNYGVCPEDVESGRPQVAGFVVRELARLRSNHRAVTDLSSWLAAGGVIGLEGVDTRALVRRIRTKGAMRGVLSCDRSHADGALVEMARRSPPMIGRNLAGEVSPPAVSPWTEGLGPRPAGPMTGAGGDSPWRVLVLDCGAKRNILRHLVDRGCEVTLGPYNLSASRIRELHPDGLLVSNGPGDPAAVLEAISVLRAVAGDMPTMGVCLGHQLLALALGARTFKLKFGHRGANQPVRNLLTGRVEITSQNHGFCVDADSLAGIDCEMTHLHLNDGTLAGFRHRSRPLFSVQYHPEASPGPHDSAYLFDCFVHMMRTGRPIDGETMRRAQARRHPVGAR